MSFFTIFVILAIIMLMSFVLLFASVKINCMNIRNAAKMELNNVMPAFMRIPSIHRGKPTLTRTWQTCI